MVNIKILLTKYGAVISYLFWGICTTVLNIISYYLFFNILNVSNVPATVIAWLIALIFAYVTNKIFVFKSKSHHPTSIIKEAISFLACRLLSGGLDVLIMYFAVDIFAMNSMIWKIISNILVVVFNYIASKLIIFKKT